MTADMEKIDELRKRVNVSYTKAKEALEASDGDMLAALIHLEKQEKCHCEGKGMVSKTKSLIGQGNSTRFVIMKKGEVVYDFSVLITLIITVLAPYVVLPALLLALFFGFRFKLLDRDGEGLPANSKLDGIYNAVREVKDKLLNDDEK